MTNQINLINSSISNSTFSASKAIIFLHPPYGPESNKLRQDITVTCKKEKLQIIKIIQSKDSYDYRAFVKLAHRISTCHNKPITVIIDDDLLSTPVNTIMWAVLGTLLAARLITVVTYKRYYSDVILRKLTKYESRFLCKATRFFKTHYCFNWSKLINKFNRNSTTSIIKQINSSTTEAILFFQSQKDVVNHNILDKIIITCVENGLKIIKTIHAKGYYDYIAFFELIHQVKERSNKPITIIINDLLPKVRTNAIFLAILSTLVIQEQVTITTYRRILDEIVLRNLKPEESNFLIKAAHYVEPYEIYEWKDFDN
jgi:hypothetical protein